MQEYIVKQNDTMQSIAQKFKIPLGQLMKANPQINPEMMHEGQTITIPDLLPVPAQLDFIESAAVNVIDDIYIGAWEEVDHAVNQIRSAMNELPPLLREAVIPENLISNMSTAVRNMEQNVTQRRTFPAISQANQITFYIADILDYFNYPVPTDINRLRYFGRQIIENVEMNNWAEAKQNYLRAKAAWERLKPELHEEHSQDASDFDKALDDLLKSIDQKDYRTAIDNADEMLDYADTLEEDFRMQSRNVIAYHL